MSSAEQLHAWIAEFVVPLDLCPFAAAPFGAGRVRIVECGSTDPAEVLAELLRECQILQADDAVETSLLVLPTGYEDFDDYLDLAYAAEDLLALQGLDEHIQLARFHPDWVFEGDEPDYPANAVGRAPVAVLHLLLVESVAAAIDGHPDPEGIPQRNADLLRDRAEEA
jgi:hypothetical protein